MGISHPFAAQVPVSWRAGLAGRRVAVVFGGESLYAGCAADVFATSATFRNAASRVAGELAAAGLGDFRDLPKLLDAAPAALSARTRNALAFLIQSALYAVVAEDWQLAPDAVLGYSVGELAASVAGGCLATRDVAELFAATTYANFDAGDAGDGVGAMAAVGGSDRAALDAAVARAGDARLVVAATYGRGNFMVAGPRGAVADLARDVEDRGGTAALLRGVRNAYHSPLHDVSTDATRLKTHMPAPSPPRVPLFSCAAGGAVAGTPPDVWWPPALVDLGALYAAPVDFAGAMAALDADVLLDLSLKGDLSYYAAAWRGPASKPAAVPTLRPSADGPTALLAARAHLATLGRVAVVDRSS